MNTRFFVIIVSLISWLGLPQISAAEKHQKPSLRLAQKLEASKDYESAILVYEELLVKDPRNEQVLKRLVACHDLMNQPETKAAAIDHDDDALPDLPGMVPNEPKEWPSLSTRPKELILP